MTDITAAYQEIVTDLHADGPLGVIRKSSFLDEAMPIIGPTLVATSDQVSQLIAVVGTLQGLNDEEIGQRIKETSLSGAFALGTVFGMELQKRGYAPPVDASLDQPSV